MAVRTRRASYKTKQDWNFSGSIKSRMSSSTLAFIRITYTCGHSCNSNRCSL